MILSKYRAPPPPPTVHAALCCNQWCSRHITGYKTLWCTSYVFCIYAQYSYIHDCGNDAGMKYIMTSQYT